MIDVIDKNIPDEWVGELEFEVGDYSGSKWGDLINSHAVVVVDSNAEIDPTKGSTRLSQKLWHWMSTTFEPSSDNPLPFYPVDIDGQTLAMPLQVEEGRFTILRRVDQNKNLIPDITLEFYYAIAPKASNVETLDKTKELLAVLYYDMLVCAHKANMEHIVLHAISSGELASDGQEKSGSKKRFTRGEFVKMTFEGMKKGIAKFQQENPNHTLRIILNNWDELGDPKINTIGGEVIKEVKHL